MKILKVIISNISWLEMLDRIVTDLSKSYEYYAACNKPKDEWDEYDHMMYPIWLRLKEFLDE
jgi:hypothetical protein